MEHLRGQCGVICYLFISLFFGNIKVHGSVKVIRKFVCTGGMKFDIYMTILCVSVCKNTEFFFKENASLPANQLNEFMD